VRETLEIYQKQNVKMGVCTNKQEASTLRLLEELELKQFFAFVAGGDTFEVHKPHPGHVTGVIERLGVATEGCIMVGDGPNDARAAQGAGVACILVTNGYGMDVGSLGANALIDSFKDLPQAIEKLGF
jgi:phosphoglycolate phosphatase